MILHVLTLRALILGVLDRFVQVVPGCNGPRKVLDLPTPNTAHWLNAFAWGYTQVQKPSYLNRVFEMAEWLISSAARRMAMRLPTSLRSGLQGMDSSDRRGLWRRC